MRKALIYSSLLLLTMLALAVALDYGHWRAIAGAMVSTGEKRSLLDEVITLRRDNADLRFQLTRAARQAEIDKAKNREHHARMVDLKREIAELEGEIEFFRDVVGGTRIGGGPRVGGLSLRALSGDGRYGYTLVLTHAGKDNQVVEGELEIGVDGTLADEPKRLPFAQLVESGAADLSFKFKHFHLFEGTLRIPTDFIPRQVQVAVRQGRKKKPTRDATFDWALALTTGTKRS